MNNIIIVNPEKCHGCNCCSLACSDTKTGKFNINKARLVVIKFKSEKDLAFPVMCQNCDEPDCMNICPEEAIYRDEKSAAIAINKDLCTECMLCVDACPYGAPWVDRENSVVEHCDLCSGDPQCVKYCSFDALQLVRKNEDSTMVRKRKEMQDMLIRLLKKIKKA